MKKILKDIENQTFAPIYLFYGQEDYLKKYYKNKLLEALVGNDMNFNRYEGKNISYKEVIDVAETLPFLDSYRLILIENSGLFDSANEEMYSYFGEIPESTIFLFVEDKVDKRGRLYKRVKEIGYPCEMKQQGEAELTKWVLKSLKKEGKNITKNNMEMFLEKTGFDMEKISRELEKLLCYTLGKDTIEKEDIENICVPDIQGKIFDMIDAMGNHNQKRTLQLYYDLCAAKEPPMRILYMITRQFNLLLQVLQLGQQGYSRTEIAQKMKVQSFIVGKCMSQSKNFSEERLKEALNESANIEEAYKNGKMNDKIGVELLLIAYSM